MMENKNLSLEEKKKALLSALLKKEGLATSTSHSIEKDKNDGPKRLSSAQERLWFLDRFEPENPLYNISVNVKLKGPLNFDYLKESIEQVIARHEILRTVFYFEGERPAQKILAHLGLPVLFTDLSGFPVEAQEQKTTVFISEAAHRVFDLASGPLINCHVLRRSDTSHVLLLTMHHIISDEASFALFFKEVSRFYSAKLLGKNETKDELKIQYSDYAAWESTQQNAAHFKKQVAFWEKKLAGNLPVLQLPLDFIRPSTQTFNGKQVTQYITPLLTDKLKQIGSEVNATLFMVLLAIYKLLLFRYSFQEDIIVGSPVNKRNRPELEKMIGYFQNTLVFRSQIKDTMPFYKLLERVRQTALDAFENQDVPFEKLVEIVQPKRDPSLNPIFQTAFIFQNNLAKKSWRHTLQIPEIEIEPLVTTSDTAKFDLTFSAEELDDGMQIGFEYNTDLFHPETIDRLLGHFLSLAESITQHPELPNGQIALLSDAERETILKDWNQTQKPFPNKCVHQLFKETAIQYPTKVALRFEDKTLTYEELDRQSDKFATYLNNKNTKPGNRIGICLERSSGMIVKLLGILKTGAAYVPLDPDFPKERLSFMISDSQLSLIISQSEFQDLFIGANPEIVFIDKLQPEKESFTSFETEGQDPSQLAYILYTSGSTGQPKGVKVPHKAVANFLTSMQQSPGIAPDDKLLAVTTLSFDISVLELFLPLISGAELVLCPKARTKDGSALLKLMKNSQTTLMQATPETWRLLLEAGWNEKLTIKILCGGETLPFTLAQKLLPLSTELWNMYGPTETTIWSTIKQIQNEDGQITIGRPINNTTCFIVDKNLQPVPVGATGELIIGGAGVTKGYWNREKLTQEKFIGHPFEEGNTSHVFRTGDLAKFLPNGEIICLGRRDHQVKVRGFRIELGEIEHILNTHSQIEKAVVSVQEKDEGTKILTAYIISKDGQPLKRRALRRFLQERLPDYMVPSFFIPLENFPLTPNGKIDRKALPKQGSNVQDTAENYFAPRTEIEKIIAEVWERALTINRAGLYDNFFDLGGHSLLSIQVINELEKLLNVRILPRDMLLQNIEQMASAISQKKSSNITNPEHKKTKGLFNSFFKK